MLQATSFFWQYSPICTINKIRCLGLQFPGADFFLRKALRNMEQIECISWMTARFDSSRKKTSRTIYCSAVYYIYIYLWTIFDHNDMYINILYRQQISQKQVVEGRFLSVSCWLMKVSGFNTPRATNNCEILSINNAFFETPKHLEGVPWSSRNCHRF